MVDGDVPNPSLAEKLRGKMKTLKPTVPQNRDAEGRPQKKPLKKCPACEADYFDTNLVVCPKDRTMLLTPQVAYWNWFECAKNDDPDVRHCPKCDGIYDSNRDRHCTDDGSELQPIDLKAMNPPLLEDRYQLLSYLGEDNLFESYLAKDLIDHTIVSVSYLSKIVSGDEKTVSHFLKLGKTAIGLNHPNLLSVYSVNLTKNAPAVGFRSEPIAVLYLVSDYVISNTLDAEIKARQWLSPQSAARVFIDMLSALSHAHEHGITHGAISTHNLRVAGGGSSREQGLVSNFGLAERLLRELDWDVPSTDTRTSSLYGDPDGLCPEFCRGLRQTPKTDQYQIGCALYEALCGRPPFERPAITRVLLAHMSEEPDDLAAKNSNIPKELIEVVLKCLKKDPEERYPSVAALSEALQQFTKP